MNAPDVHGDATTTIAAFDVDCTLTRRDCVVPFLKEIAGWRWYLGLARRIVPLTAAILRRDRDTVKGLVTAAAVAMATNTSPGLTARLSAVRPVTSMSVRRASNLMESVRSSPSVMRAADCPTRGCHRPRKRTIPQVRNAMMDRNSSKVLGYWMPRFRWA